MKIIIFKFYIFKFGKCEIYFVTTFRYIIKNRIFLKFYWFVLFFLIEQNKLNIDFKFLFNIYSKINLRNISSFYYLSITKQLVKKLVL